MTDANGITISNITANAAVWAPGEPVNISFKFKNGSGAKITDLYLGIIVQKTDFSGAASNDKIVLSRVTGEDNFMQRVNLANGKSRTFTATFNVPDAVSAYFTEYPEIRSAPIYIDYLAHDSSGSGFGTEFELSNLRILNHRFTPQITEMNLVRAKDGIPNNEGENVLTTLKLGVNTGNYDYTRFMAAKIYMNQGGEATTADSYIDITGSIPSLLSGAVNNPDLIPGTYDKAYDWDFLLVFGDEYEAFYGRFNLGMAFANLHLSGVSTGGACFGGFSTSGYGKPKLESYYPGYFYKGINKLGEDWNYLTPLEGTTPAEFGGGQLRCRKVENKCIVEGSLMVKPGSSTLVLAALPDGYTPEKGVFSINACEGGRVARIVVGGSGEENAGKLCMSWVKNLTDGSNYTAAAIWVQCSIEYWVEAPEDDVVSTANLIDSTGAIVTDVTGREIAVRSTGGEPYQSIYTGKQIDDGITAANNAASRTYVDDAISQIELLPGPAGPAGPTGATGATGPAGPSGAAGSPGKSAYEYAQEGGYEGTEEEFTEDLGKVGTGGGTAESVAWENVTGKPFGDIITGTSVANGDSLTWDGDVKKTPLCVDNGTIFKFYYVSENLPSHADLEAGFECERIRRSDGAVLTGGVNLSVQPDPWIDFIYDAAVGTTRPYIYIIRNPVSVGAGYYFPRAGIYFSNFTVQFVSKLTISGYTFTQPTTLAGIDTTLTQPSRPADAKAVGEAVFPISEAFEKSSVPGEVVLKTTYGTTVSDAITGGSFVHVSDYAPDVSLIEGGFELTLLGEIYSHTGFNYKGDGYYNLLSTGAWVIARDNLSVTEEGHTTVFPKKGTYFAVSGNNALATKLTSPAMQAKAEELILKEDRIPTLSELIMQSPDGKKFRITIDNNGNLVLTEI